MIVLVQSKEEVLFGEYTNLEVKGINTKTNKATSKTIYYTLKDKWGLIQENKPIELVMKNTGTSDNPKWQVVDIKPPPAVLTSDTPQTDTPKEEPHRPPLPTIPNTPTRDISGQELGLWWKEIGMWIREGKLRQRFPEDADHMEAQYWLQMNRVLGLGHEKEKPAKD